MVQLLIGVLMSNSPRIRSAQLTDLDGIVALIQALAEYEKLRDQVTGDPEKLGLHLFGDRPFASALVAEVDQTLVGYALYFFNYSTFKMQPGLYLEDLFVLPEHRRSGIGSALIKAVAKEAVAKGCVRYEWTVLDWNQPAIEFYQKMGAEVLPDWRVCRVTGEALRRLGGG
jgi:GNAT superfamily N-acetyltransferase